MNDNAPTVGGTLPYTITLANDASATAPAYNLVINDPLPFELSLNGNITLSDPSLGSVTAGNVNGETTLTLAVPRLLPGETLTVDYEVFVGFNSPVVTESLTNVASVQGGTNPDGANPGRSHLESDDEEITADPVQSAEEDEEIFDLGIDDAQFLRILAIDPIFSGTAEPGSNVTINLYRSDGSLTYVRNIVADAGGHWIAIFPRVELEAVQDDFYSFYAGSTVFDARPGSLLYRVEHEPTINAATRKRHV